jgi:hypothetical protein
MDICDALDMISDNARREQDDRKKQWLDKVEQLEKIAVIFEDNKDPLTALELRRSANALRGLGTLRNLS